MGLLEYCGVRVQPQQRRLRLVPRPVAPDLPIVLSSDTSGEDLPQPEQLLQEDVVINIDTSEDELPNIDPRPQHQLPVLPLVDLGHLDVTYELEPPLEHQCLREAYVLLRRLQEPQLRPVTPPPERPQRDQTPPLDQEDWVVLEAAVANFDGQQQVVFVPPPVMIQQPDVVPFPELVPATFEPPQPLQQVDWATIAHALFSIAERESRQLNNNNN